MLKETLFTFYQWKLDGPLQQLCALLIFKLTGIRKSTENSCVQVILSMSH